MADFKTKNSIYVDRCGRFGRLMAVFALTITLAACGTGGGSGDPATTVSISGNVSNAVITAPKNKAGAGIAPSYAAEDWSGGTIEIIDSFGTVLTSTTIGADGSYSFTGVTAGSNYILRARHGNVVLTAFIPDATSDLTGTLGVDVDPQSTAVVEVLESILGVTDLGEAGTDASSAMSALDMAATVASIEAASGLSTVTDAIVADITANADYSADETVAATVGGASTAGETEAAALADSITTTGKNPSVAVNTAPYVGDLCSNGGITVETGIDDNGNGVLDADEVDNTQIVCHGTDGASGDTGATGDAGDTGADGTDGSDGLTDN